MIVTVLKHKTCTDDQTLIRNIKDLNILQTIKEKENAPLWNFTRTPNRKEKSLSISGIVIDYDDYELPPFQEDYIFYTHQTHSNKYRIIIPFDREYEYPGDNAYEDEYLHILRTFIKIDVLMLFERNIIQKSCCNASRWFFMRPQGKELIKKGGERFYKPTFKIQSVLESKRFMRTMAQPKNYELANENIKTGILLRIFNFYTYYSEIINWSILDTKGKCIFDWHDEGKCGSLFNNPTESSKAFICCKHATCYDKLLEYSLDYQNKDKEKGPTHISCPTILYLAVAVIKGIWAIEWIEMTVFKNYPYLLGRIDRLQRLRFNAKIDAPTWIKTYHQNAIVEPDSLEMYDYENNVYQLKSTDNLTHEYEYTIGTYYAYRTSTGKKHLRSKPYVDDLVRYSQACMLNNYDSVQKIEHMNLKNGLLIFNTEKGKFHFQSHDRHILSKIQLSYDYNPQAKCPLWVKTLKDYFEVIESPQVHTLQEFFGYCLTYDRSLEKILFLFGASRGGKGTITHTLQHLVGGGDCSMEYLLIPERRSSLCENKKMIFIDEIPNFTSKNVINELKRMSSTGGMEMRKLHQQPYISYEVPKMVIAFNQLPPNFEIDTALKNRMISLKFVKSFIGKEDIHLKEKLMSEAPGILNWALEGYERIYQRKRFNDYSQATIELYNQANDEMREIAVFLREKGRQAMLWKTSELLECYQEATGDFKMTQQRFYRLIKWTGVTRKVKNGYYFYNLEEV